MKISAELLLPLILSFIKDFYAEKDLKAFCKYFDLDEQLSSMEKDPLVKAGGLKTILEAALKSDKKLREQLQKHLGLENGEAKDNGKQQKKRDTKEADKKSKKKVESDSSSDDEPVKKKKDISKKRPRADSVKSSASVASRTRGKSEDKIVVPKDHKEMKFKRIDETKLEGQISAQFGDCSFEAKARFGQGGDSYGQWSSDKLKSTQGASFVKMKNKMKNRNTHASGTFNQSAVNSVKFA